MILGAGHARMVRDEGQVHDWREEDLPSISFFPEVLRYLISLVK